MQIKDNRTNYLHNPKIIGTLKVLLLGGCCYFILTKFQHQSIDFSQLKFPEQSDWVIPMVCMLMLVNWYLEALRWKISLQSSEPISIKESWQSILSGLALNWIMPFTSGDLLARIARQQDKYQATSAAFLNRGIMLSFTSLMGMYGISKFHMSLGWSGWYMLLALILIGAIFLLRKSLQKFLDYFREIKRPQLFRVIALSFARYVVFVIQFYLLLKLFLPELSTGLLVGGIGWIFLIRSILPLFIGGVGVREASGIVFFEPHVSDLELVIIPVFLIWLINTVIPSMLGLFYVARFKYSS